MLHIASTEYRSLILVSFVFAEGLPHTVPGAGAGESEGGAGNKEQPASSEREETDGDGQTGTNTIITLSLLCSFCHCFGVFLIVTSLNVIQNQLLEFNHLKLVHSSTTSTQHL